MEPSKQSETPWETDTVSPGNTLGRWLRSANHEFALASRLRRPQGDSFASKRRLPCLYILDAGV